MFFFDKFFILLWVFGSLSLQLHAKSHNLETRYVVRIPTGNHRMARNTVLELEQLGLGECFDRARTMYSIEAMVTHVELMRIQHLKPVILRNMTNLEPGAAHPGSAYASRLPINKRRYHTSQDIEHTLRALTRAHPDRASLQNVGRSARGAILWALKISGEPRGSTFWKPSVLLTGSPHGNDLFGREMCLWVAEHLCDTYATLSETARILDKVDVYVMPDPSPDASVLGQRYNVHGKDIDRSFPDRFASLSNPDVPEPEVTALKRWAAKRRFVASASYLGGGGGPGYNGMVIRYPWNANKQRAVGHVDRSPDDRAFQFLARTYANAHPTLAREDPRGSGSGAGLVNAAEWYHRYGSFQDWMYARTGSLHLDLVVSPYLQPLPQRLQNHWNANQAPTMALLKVVGQHGLRGRLVDDATGAVVSKAIVYLRDLNDRGRQLLPLHPEETHGLFGRVLVAGKYAVWASAPNYLASHEVIFHLRSDQPAHTVAIRMIRE